MAVSTVFVVFGLLAIVCVLTAPTYVKDILNTPAVESAKHHGGGMCAWVDGYFMCSVTSDSGENTSSLNPSIHADM
ncbi:hypothetical protein J6590_104045 [Homalodisca vitripennis]|nr:hypothetical protein J6590_104045 [Homalodisca vitripennis]